MAESHSRRTLCNAALERTLNDRIETISLPVSVFAVACTYRIRLHLSHTS